MSLETRTPLNPQLLARAMVAAAQKLGLEGVFLRIAAAELPDECWSIAFTLAEEEDGGVTALGRHRCLPGCRALRGHCLTALKAEDVVSKRLGRPYAVHALQVEGDDAEGQFLRLRLRPFD